MACAMILLCPSGGSQAVKLKLPKPVPTVLNTTKVFLLKFPMALWPGHCSILPATTSTTISTSVQRYICFVQRYLFSFFLEIISHNFTSGLVNEHLCDQEIIADG